MPTDRCKWILLVRPDEYLRLQALAGSLARYVSGETVTFDEAGWIFGVHDIVGSLPERLPCDVRVVVIWHEVEARKTPYDYPRWNCKAPGHLGSEGIYDRRCAIRSEAPDPGELAATIERFRQARERDEKPTARETGT